MHTGTRATRPIRQDPTITPGLQFCAHLDVVGPSGWRPVQTARGRHDYRLRQEVVAGQLSARRLERWTAADSDDWRDDPFSPQSPSVHRDGCHRGVSKPDHQQYGDCVILRTPSIS